MSEAKHSPLPWKLDKWLNVVDANGERVVLSGFAVAFTPNPVTDANTELQMELQRAACDSDGARQLFADIAQGDK